MFMYICDSDKIDIAILFFICKNKTRKNREFYILNLSPFLILIFVIIYLLVLLFIRNNCGGKDINITSLSLEQFSEIFPVASQPLCDSRSLRKGFSLDVPPWKTRGLALLPTATRFHDHVLVLFIYHVVGRVNEQDANGTQPRRHATGRRCGFRVHRVHQGLNDCMVCGLQVGAQGELTQSFAVEGLIL